MSLVKFTFLGLLVLPAAELVAFIVVAALIGWIRASVLLVATSLVGVFLMRRSGRGDLNRLRSALAVHGIRALHLETPGVAAMLGGILLVLPGFITDLMGAALLFPPFRRWAAGWLARTARARRAARPNDRVIDLERNEWHQIQSARRGRRKLKGDA